MSDMTASELPRDLDGQPYRAETDDRPVESQLVLRGVRGVEQHRRRPGGARLQAVLRRAARRFP